MWCDVIYTRRKLVSDTVFVFKHFVNVLKTFLLCLSFYFTAKRKIPSTFFVLKNRVDYAAVATFLFGDKNSNPSHIDEV